MVIGEVDVIMAHPLPAGMVLVTVYEPGVLAPIFTWPVEVLKKTNPPVELNVPATPPRTGVGFEAVVQ